MTSYMLLMRARRCHRSANAIRAHATSAPFATREAVMREIEIAENLEAMADKSEREAIGRIPHGRAPEHPAALH